MRFLESQADKLTTCLFNKWIVGLVLAVSFLGMTKAEIMNLAVVTIQTCALR